MRGTSCDHDRGHPGFVAFAEALVENCGSLVRARSLQPMEPDRRFMDCEHRASQGLQLLRLQPHGQGCVLVQYSMKHSTLASAHRLHADILMFCDLFMEDDGCISCLSFANVCCRCARIIFGQVTRTQWDAGISSLHIDLQVERSFESGGLQFNVTVHRLCVGCRPSRRNSQKLLVSFRKLRLVVHGSQPASWNCMVLISDFRWNGMTVLE